MRPETYRMLAARQAVYWWHRARRQMAAALLRREGLGMGCRVLDLGCGAGGNLAMLQAFHPALTIGVDLSDLAIALARAADPTTNLVRADISRPLPFADGTIDVVTILNVLCHDWVVSEVAVLREVARVLRPGGLILITEPAFGVLAREMDEAAMAHRRYHRRDVAAMCRQAGVAVKYTSYFTSFGFPLLLGMKMLRRFTRAPTKSNADLAPDMKPLHPVINEIMRFAAAIEGRLIASGIPMPFGTTLICVARKL